MRSPLPRISWFLVILALLALAYNGVLIGLAALSPTDGCSLYPDKAGLVVNSAPQESPLQPGDIITAIGGRAVGSETARPGVWQRFLFGTAAGGATYTVQRGAERLELGVPWQQRSLPQVLGEVGLLSLIGTIFILNSILLLLSRTRDPAAPAMALFFLVEGFNLVNNAWLATGTSLTLSTFWFFHPLDLLSFGLTFAAALHCLLVFPEPKAVAQRFPLLHSFVYSANLLVAMAGIVAAIVGTAPAMRTLTYRVFYPLAGVELLAGIGLITHTYVTTRRPGVRNQIRWLIWGVILGPLPWLLLYSLPVALGGTPLLPLGAAALALIVIPAAFFFSVTRRGLTAVDTVINRTMVYSALVVVLVGAYLLTVAGLDALSRALLGVSDSRVSAVVAIILVAVAANPLRVLLQRLTQRLFYRHWIDMQQLLREVGERLSTTLQFDAIVPMLTEEIPSRLRLTQAALLLRQGDGTFTSSGGGITGFPADHPLVVQAAAGEAPLVVSQSGRRAGVHAELAAAGWEVGLPLRSGGRLVGLYLLGPRQSGDLYTRQEVEALRAVGRQAAATLENAYLYSQVERYTQQLQDLVSARTRELAQVNLDLASERDRLNVVLQNMADGLLVTDPGGLIVLMNPALEGLLRQRADQLIGQPASSRLGLPALADLLAQAGSEAGRVLTGDLPFDEKVLRASATALHDRAAVITVLRDITQEKEVDRMKTEFVSTVSHELRAPLTSVLGFAKLIGKAVERDMVPWIPAEDSRGQRAVSRVREDLAIIVSEGERLTRLINDVLDIAKMEAGRIEWRDQTFDLPTVIYNAVENVRTVASAKSLPINLQLQVRLPSLYADPDRILQVVTNLLSNAIKFTDRGQVTVGARLLNEGERPHGWSVPEGCLGGVLVTVEDSGIGIPAEALGRLFQRFQQVESAIVNRPRGTGLGLAICREIVTHYGGVIWADSVEGKGSTFCFTVPQAPVPVKEAAPPVPAARPPRQPTVLVVDDEAPVRQLLHQLLSEAGYRVVEAADGNAGINQGRQERPDLVILDMTLPGLSGTDVAQLLKADPVTAQIPILILSVEDPRSGTDLAHLTKPVQMDALLKAVADLVGRGRDQPGKVLR